MVVCTGPKYLYCVRVRCHGSIVGKRGRGEARAKIENEAHRHGSEVDPILSMK
jgi:hypothetical protein